MSTETKRFLQGAFWIAVYLILVLAPLFILLLGPVARTKGFWIEFSVGLGFSGLAMIGLQFALTARFKHIKAVSVPPGICSWVAATARRG